MESSGNRMMLEAEIMIYAKRYPLVLDLESPSTQIELVQELFFEVNSQHTTKAKHPKDCAILFKRFCIYSETIF